MTPEREEAVERICLGALERDGPARQQWIRDACAGDAALLQEVQSLLRHEVTAARALSRPALEAAAATWGIPAPALQIGQQIGHLAIVAHLGRGGMGEVYRARDTTLRRDVAVKVLPRAFADDANRLARFQREARVLAALNHPQIGAIYGVEAVDGGLALVLECVDGETLAERLARSTGGQRGRLPLVEALGIARQIAGALEAAHERGIVHRDLKPANIKLRPDGTVKVLDFGLATVVSAGEGVDASHGPTVGVSTEAGLVLGTAAYMSPEQARGLAVDKRTDIWAFGCVVYEMLTGRAAFAGDTRTDVLAAVLHREPEWKAVPRDLDAVVPLVLRRCLAKDPMDRVRDIGDVQLAFAGAFTPQAVGTASRLSLWRRWLPLAAIGMGGFLAGAGFLIGPRPVSMPVTKLSLNIRPAITSPHSVAITPDGSRIVYVADTGRQLLVRALETLEPVVLATGEVLSRPFISPDGQWVAFFESGTMTGGNSPGAATLKKVPVTGGVPTTVALLQGTPNGATWLADDTIVFAAGYGRRNLQRLPIRGGTPTVLVEPNEAEQELEYLWPQRLAGGACVLFTVRTRSNGLESARIALYDLGTGLKKLLVSGGSDAQEVNASHLVYVAAGGLWAVPFDARRREASGVPMAVFPRGLSTTQSTGTFAVASNGTLVYAAATGEPAAATRTLVWVDRHGHEQPLVPGKESYLHPRLSHDGTHLAAAIYFGGGATNVGVWDLSRDTLTRVDTEAALDVSPVWTPDDRWILFTSNREGGTANIWRQHADGTGTADHLIVSPNRQSVTSLSPDGTHVIFQEYTPARGWDVMQLSLDATRRVEPLVQTSFDEDNAVLSPDGRWLAYESNSSGQLEVYVQPYPNASGQRWKVSTAGGTAPAWVQTEKELFFLALDESLMSVPIRGIGTRWSAGVPTKVLPPGYFTAGGNIGRQYEVSPDGQRFIMIKSSGTATVNAEVVVVQHWDQELRTRVPVK